MGISILCFSNNNCFNFSGKFVLISTLHSCPKNSFVKGAKGSTFSKSNNFGAWFKSDDLHLDEILFQSCLFINSTALGTVKKAEKSLVPLNWW